MLIWAIPFQGHTRSGRIPRLRLAILTKQDNLHRYPRALCQIPLRTGKSQNTLHPQTREDIEGVTHGQGVEYLFHQECRESCTRIPSSVLQTEAVAHCFLLTNNSYVPGLRWNHGWPASAVQEVLLVARTRAMVVLWPLKRLPKCLDRPLKCPQSLAGTTVDVHLLRRGPLCLTNRTRGMLRT